MDPIVPLDQMEQIANGHRPRRGHLRGARRHRLRERREGPDLPARAGRHRDRGRHDRRLDAGPRVGRRRPHLRLRRRPTTRCCAGRPAASGPDGLERRARRTRRSRPPTGVRSRLTAPTTCPTRAPGRRATAVLIVVRQVGTHRSGPAESVDFPNGLAVSPDGRELWVLEITPGPLVAFDDPRRRLRRAAARPRRAARHGPRRHRVRDRRLRRHRLLPARRRLPLAPGLGARGAWPRPRGRGPRGAHQLRVRRPGPGRRSCVPNIGRWHVTRFRVPGLAGVPLFYPTREQLGG